MPRFPKSLTGAAPTREALPLLLSKPDAYLQPANLGGHLSKSSREPTLGSCSGRPPFLKATEEDGCPGEMPTWSRSPSLRRTPSAGRSCGGPALPPCPAPSPQHCTHLASQHLLPVTKGGHDAFRPNTGPSGEESRQGKAPPAYSSGCLPPPPYPAPQGGPCPAASVAQHHRQLSAPPRGSQGDRGEGGCHTGLNYCHDDMFFNLYPLRWPGLKVLSPPSSGSGPNSPSLSSHGCESAAMPITSLAPLAGLRRGFHASSFVFILFFF